MIFNLDDYIGGISILREDDFDFFTQNEGVKKGLPWFTCLTWKQIVEKINGGDGLIEKSNLILEVVFVVCLFFAH